MTIETFAQAEEIMAQALPGYKARPQQQRLAQALENILSFTPDDPRAILAQAGCGVGKSLAILISSILSGKRTIVATATKALQTQYAEKDLPFLEENLPVDFTWALLKGRSNYVCASKMAEITTVQLAEIGRLREELADPEHTGDFEDLLVKIADDKQYLLSMSSSECPGKSECPLAEACFAERAKEKAKAADIVITNSAMLMVDLKLRQVSDDAVRMLGDYDAVVIDEAHELGEIAANAMADRLTRRSVEVLLSMSERFLGEHEGSDVSKTVGEVKDAIDAIWDHLAELIADGDQIELKVSELQNNIEPYITVVDAMKALHTEVSQTQLKIGNPTREAARQRRLAKRIISMVSTLTEFIITPGMVRWLETEKTRKNESIIVLKWSPIEVGPFLNEQLWSRVPAALVSATLAVGGDFTYMIEDLGLEQPETLDVGTPFDYATQARLFIPNGKCPDPAKERASWISYAQTTTRDLVNASGGGALLLYTSRSAMVNAYEMLSPVFEMAGYTCLMQGRHGTNKELAAQFKNDTHSVLFAVKSFFTGVDFSGDTCRLVIIDKLPFPVPTDIMYSAKASLIERRTGDQWASFNKLAVPMMTLPLVQGAGRLIRSVSDTGVVAILDPRIRSKGYGKRIIKSLPPAPMTDSVAEVADFYAA